MKRLEALRAWLTAPVDVAPLVLFRLVFGLAMFYEVARYFGYGWIERDYVAPAFHFTFLGFGWVRPWPGAGMYLHMYALGGLALCTLTGFCYRAATALFFLGFGYLFLLDEVYYLNHFYLITLLAGLMCLVPSAGALSVDAARDPAARTDRCARWQLELIRGQVALVYVYAGIAKIGHDWLSGMTMGTWLRDTGDIPVLGPLFMMKYTPLVMSWSGMCFDLLVVPAVLWRRTRPFALAASVCFHGLNLVLFDIGVFPPLMLGATLLFVDPAWCRRLLDRWTTPAPTEPPRLARPCVSLLILWFALQLTLPFRYLLYPGDPLWTDEANRFSWWMILRHKTARARFVARDPASGAEWDVRPADYLSPAQTSTMVVWPDMIQQFCRHVAQDLERRIARPVEIHAWVWCSLNGRPPALLLDPKVDLAKVTRDVWPARWITPGPGEPPR